VLFTHKGVYIDTPKGFLRKSPHILGAVFYRQWGG
jgi:hypothetical protein